MSWAAALDAYDSHLAEVQRALDAGMADVVPAFGIPTGLPQLPADLAERAMSLLRLGEQLAAALAAARDAAGAVLEHRPRPAPPPPRPSMIDVHA